MNLNSNFNQRQEFKIAAAKWITFIALIFLISSCSWIGRKLKGEEVKIRETELIIPTYLVGDAEEGPMFYTPENYQGAQMHIYPYALIDSISDRKVNKKYKAIILENRYIEICVLPELGGRLYYARDKTNGYEFFYHNHVIKPALIGMAGAWISGGIEWNIPHHHRVSTFMPVDYRMVSNTDGSKTIWIGEYEKRHQTKWNVGLTLYPGKSYIETRINLFNTTPLVQSFLIWANTAVHANENYQVIFPPDVSKAVFHSKVEFTDWPVSKQYYMGIDFTKGVDVSWWKNTSSPTSFFAWGSDKDFLAGIDHGKNAGVVLIGDHSISRGKKMWNWGKNDVASLWDKKLTDEDGTYLELMMGAYSDNQPDYSWNHPGFTKSATMVYYPIKGLHNIKEANRNMAINLEMAGDSIIVQASGNEKGQKCFVKLVYDNSQVLLKDEAVIDPEHPYERKIRPQQAVVFEKTCLSILSSDGEVLIRYQPQPIVKSDNPQTYKSPESPEKIKTVDQLYEAGLRLEQFYNPNLDPLPYYLEALHRDSTSILVQTQLGIYYLKKNRLIEAEKHLRSAYSFVTANFTVPKYSEPAYYLGICLYTQNKIAEAYKILHEVSWSAEWLSPASLAIAKIECSKGNFDHALKHIQMAIQANPYNIEATNLCTTILRHMGQYEKAVQLAQRSLATDPLDHQAFNELKILQPLTSVEFPVNDLTLEYQKLMRNESNNFLELASRYLESGFADDAIRLLQEGANENKDIAANPLINYYLGYAYHLKNDTVKAGLAWKKAMSLSEKGCFPFGYFTSKVLAEALAMNTGDGKAWYYLGNLLCDDQPAKALECWKKASTLNPGMAMVYRNMAFLEANEFDDMNEAMEDINHAIRLSPSSVLFRLEADHYLEYLLTSPEKRLAELTKQKDIIIKSDELFGRYLELQTWMGKPDIALEGLEKHHFHGSEISDINYHDAWVNAQILKGMQLQAEGKSDEAISHFNKAMEFPFNLESSRDSKIGISFLLLARIYEQKKENTLARENFQKIIDFVMPHGWGAGESPEIAYCKAIAFKKMGQSKEADEYIHSMFKVANDLLIAKPHSAEYTNSVKLRLHRRQSLANGYYMMALANMASGNSSEARGWINKLVKIEPSHFGGKYFDLFTRGN
jgi:tetratricopeptide (TPR) repeat protein